MKRTQTNINRVLIPYGALRLLITIKRFVKLLSNPPFGGQAFKLFKKRKEVHAYALSQQFPQAEGQ